MEVVYRLWEESWEEGAIVADGAGEPERCRKRSVRTVDRGRCGQDALHHADRLDISVSNGPRWITVTLDDNGPGIPEKIIGSIFEPFFTTRENGTGLGLAIVKQIVESHNGDISVDTIAGQGTTFTIALPLP